MLRCLESVLYVRGVVGNLADGAPRGVVLIDLGPQYHQYCDSGVLEHVSDILCLLGSAISNDTSSDGGIQRQHQAGSVKVYTTSEGSGCRRKAQVLTSHHREDGLLVYQ